MVKMPDLAAPAVTMVHHDIDREIFARLKSDDQGALRVLFDKYFDPLASVAMHIVKDENSARDVAQTVFIALWQKRNKLRIDTAVFPYLRRMAVHEALAKVRTTSRRLSLLNEHYGQELVQRDVESEYLQTELEDHLSRAIDELPAQSGTVFRLSRFEQMSNKDIARSMDISVKTVENHMTRALKQLRQAVTRYMHLFL